MPTHNDQKHAAMSEQTRDDAFWRALAERKWGQAVFPAAAKLRAARAAAAGDAATTPPPPNADDGWWKEYCARRMSLRTVPRSPLALLQEAHADPFEHVVACVLCR